MKNTKLTAILTIFFTLILAGCSSIQQYIHKHPGYFAAHRTPSKQKTFIFDPKHLAWAAYDRNGNLLRIGRASGGGNYCPDIGRACHTIVGTFRIIAKGGSTCKSSKFPLKTNGGAPMPYCMHFHSKGYAIHGSYDVPNYNASHGCIRVVPKDAKWLNEHFIEIGSKVIVRPY
ncbi:MAG: L,D-transpeptidase [Gammaproteobacteria bacterium]|nr:L,D-transpeptidase [Gammaproteobacteria bacterium]